MGLHHTAARPDAARVGDSRRHAIAQKHPAGLSAPDIGILQPYLSAATLRGGQGRQRPLETLSRPAATVFP